MVWRAWGVKHLGLLLFVGQMPSAPPLPPRMNTREGETTGLSKTKRKLGIEIIASDTLPLGGYHHWPLRKPTITELRPHWSHKIIHLIYKTSSIVSLVNHLLMGHCFGVTPNGQNQFPCKFCLPLVERGTFAESPWTPHQFHVVPV
jgi:hypothetical protein